MQKVLLVEDNEMNWDMLSRRLIRRGYEVELAFDGEDGLRKAGETLPDIILLDMSLPIIDGWETAKQLKANDNTKNIPIIALTAYALTGDREKAIDAGCDEYETKPIDLERLLEKMNMLLGGLKP